MMKCFSLRYEADAHYGRVDVEVRGSGSWLMETMLKRNAISTVETKRTLGIPLVKDQRRG
jgi:hypothetical protein